MALYADRVKDSTSITGIGAATLAGTSSAGYQTFATAFPVAQTVAYCIADQTGPNWEVGTGVFNGATNLTRVTVLGSSNAGALVAFTGGTQDVFCTAPAAYLDTFTSAHQGTVPASGGGTTNFLRADATFAAPPVAAPAGSDTQVQYNAASVFGSNANLTYDYTNNVLNTPKISSVSGGLTITPFAPAAGTAPVALVITGAASQDASGGGQVQINGGAALTPSTGIGGSLGLKGGNASSAVGGGF